MSPLSLVKLGPRTREKDLSVVPHALTWDAKTRSVVNNSAVDYSISLKFLTESAVKIQGQEVKGQGHSVT